MRIKSIVMAAAAAGSVLMLAIAPSAWAGTDATSETSGAKAKFISYGDKFTVCDTSWDTFQPYVEYKYIRKNGSLQQEEHWNGNGDGTCVTWDHDFGEGRSVTFRACVGIPGVPIDPCDDWKIGIA
ncbi:hypothetical protein ACWFQ8_33520 [Streptomyces sp. NPDC055254]